ALPVNLRPLKFALDWEHAKKIPWEILLLFGGGLSLSKAINSSGLGAWLGESVAGFGGGSQILFILIVVLTVIFLTEFSSNLATAALFLPLLASLAPQIILADGNPLNPAALMIPTALAASCAFMLPVATPPNAIVFGSGYLEIRSMVKAGIWLNLIGAVLITIWTMTYGRFVLNF
ncbi:MAG: SLC13 family permease, partial [Planctomycetota bacterium]|nr:SLC13 family permease [Planctomycetota bacterium]